MRDIQAIITDYWNCAYQQGLEYREHDDEKGTAQRLEDELQAWVAAHSTPHTYAQGQEREEDCQCRRTLSREWAAKFAPEGKPLGCLECGKPIRALPIKEGEK